jgi:gluconokinase
MIVVVMGPSASGKTTAGAALARTLGWAFLDADSLHPAANVAKMARGEALDDADRAPWLARVAAEIRARLEGNADAVVACSALKAAYRAELRGGDERVRFVYLKVPPSVLAERLSARQGHYMPPSLLASQLATLEEPEDALVVDGDADVPTVVAAIRHGLAI